MTQILLGHRIDEVRISLYLFKICKKISMSVIVYKHDNIKPVGIATSANGTKKVIEKIIDL